MFYKIGIPKYSRAPNGAFSQFLRTPFLPEHFRLIASQYFGKFMGNHLYESVYFVKCYIQGALWKKQYHRSFCRAPKISRKHDFYTFTFGLTWLNKINKTRIRALYIFKLLYTGCSTKKAILLLLKFQEKMTFAEVFLSKTWQNKIEKVE